MGRCMFCNNRLDRKNKYFCNNRCRRKYNQKDMILTLKKQWFDMILSGVKTEEYREIKPYWTTRFQNYFGSYIELTSDDIIEAWSKQKKVIVFRNGYDNNVPEFRAEVTISEGYGKEEWGADKNTKYYVLTIHRVFGIKNTN